MTMNEDDNLQEELEQWLDGTPEKTLRKLRHDVLGYVMLVDGTADFLLQDLADSEVDPQLMQMLAILRERSNDISLAMEVLGRYCRFLKLDDDNP